MSTQEERDARARRWRFTRLRALAPLVVSLVIVWAAGFGTLALISPGHPILADLLLLLLAAFASLVVVVFAAVATTRPDES